MEKLKNIIQVQEKSKYSNYITVLAYIIDSCNYNCSYCYNKKPRTNNILDLDKLYNYLDFIHEQTNRNIKLELIGGEPTLHPDLLNFCEKYKNTQWLTILILTNLNIEIDTIYKYLNTNTILTATYHYLNLSFLDKIKLIDFKYYLNNQVELRIMVENGINYNTSIQILKQLIHSKYNKYTQCGLLSINQYNTNLYSTTQLNEYNTLRKQIDNFRSFYEVKYLDNTFEMLEFNDMFLNEEMSFKNWQCNAGKDYFYIHANGDIYPCETYYDQNINKILGNVNNLDKLNFKYNKRTLCKCIFCTSCDFGIKKSKIFI